MVTNPNELTRPDGALEVADNCVIDADNVIESRRGFSDFGSATSDSSIVKQLIPYKGRILRHFSDKLSFDSDGNGTFLNFSGSYTELISKLRIKYFELNSNLYFTTDSGIKKISASTSEDFSTDVNFITNAGGIKAVNLEAKLKPKASGWFPAQSKVAYKLLWAYKDNNNNIIRGVPTSRVVITNTSQDINIGEKFSIAVNSAAVGNINGEYILFETPISKYALWFDSTGTTAEPVAGDLIGRELYKVELNTITSPNNLKYAAKIASTLSLISDISVELVSNVITVTNTQEGDVFDASQGTVSSSELLVSKVIDGQITTGTPATVELSFPIPNEVISTQYFYEVYRTAVITVQIGNTLETIDPGEEFQKVYEGTIETTTGDITFEDITPETFREGGAYLYTNEISGQGILQANEPPPIAHDVAIFKGSAFYANTKERHKLQFNLLSVLEFLSGTSKLYIGNSTSLSEFTFVGRAELVDVIVQPKSTTVGNSYILLNSARDAIKYKLWFDKGIIRHNYDSTTEITGATITVTSHGFANGDTVKFSGTLPAELNATTTYYVVNRNINDFQVSTSVGGSAIVLSTVVGTSTVTHTPLEPVVADTISLRVALQTYADTLAGSVESITDTFFDVVDFDLGSPWDASSNSPSLSDNTGQIGDIYRASTSGSVNFGSGSITFAIGDYVIFNGTVWQKLTGTGPAGVKIFYNDNGAVTNPTDSTPASAWTFSVTTEGLGEDASNNEVLISGLKSVGQSVEDTARSLERVINKDPNCPVNAYYISGVNDLPGILLLESRSLVDDTFYLAVNQDSMSDNFSPVIPVAKEVTLVSSSSPEAIFTTATNHGYSIGQQLYTFIDPDTTSILVSGKKIVSSTPALTTFSLSGFTSTSSYSTFDKALVFKADVASDNSVNPNRIFFSKISQPEAVPSLNFIDIGPKDKPIQRILALRDSLIVLKEDGVYAVTGSAAPNFSVRLVDNSALTYAPDTAVNLNNLIYVLTTQGIVTVSETGVGVISRNIENKIQEIANAKYDYKLTSWGISSESDRCYIIFLPTKVADGVATQAYRFNTFTRAWTRWTIASNCGAINPQDDKIYLSDGLRPYVLKERKNFERQDYADRDFVRNIIANAVSGNKLSLSSATEIEVGDVIAQVQYLDINKFNRLLKKLDRDSLNSDDYYSTLNVSTGVNLASSINLLYSKLISDGVGAPAPSGINTPEAIRDDINAIISYLNTVSSGTGFKNYRLVVDELVYESLITEVNLNLNTITLKYMTHFIEGSASIYKGIKTKVQYTPQHFGKPESTKQISEGTFIFDQNNFWSGIVSYSSDRSYDFSSINFNIRGPGFWDGYNWAEVVFGGEGNEVPVRTLVPRDKSRCRYMHIQFTHFNAREKWRLLGVSVEPREISTRGYR